MSSKTKTGLFQTPVSKPSPATPRGRSGSSSSLKSDAESPSNIPRFARPTTPRGKLGSSSSSLHSDADSTSSNPRFSIDRVSPKTVTSRPVSRSSPRVSTPDKTQPRMINKPSELQAQLQTAQDELKKAKEKLVFSEKEKSQALIDLKEAKKQADEANEKLEQALVAQKRAQESSEIEKFRAVEMEQSGIEAAQKKDEDWKKEVESLKSQLLSSQDGASFDSNEELERVKRELAIVIDTKNQALAHADAVTKIAEIHVKKVEFLSSELVRLKGLLESNDKNEQLSESGAVVEELDSLREELKKAKIYEQELIEKEKLNEKNMADLKLELESHRDELDKAKAFKEELVEKEKSYEKIVEEMKVEITSRENDLEKAKICEEELIEEKKTHEKALRELKVEMALMEEKLLKANTFERDLTEKENSYGKTISELKSNMDSLQQDFQKLESSEKDYIEREKANDFIITELKSEIGLLKLELEKVRGLEETLVASETSYEKTIVELKSEIDLLNQELEKAESIESEMIKKHNSNEDIIRDLESEIRLLKQDQQVSKISQEKLMHMEESYEQMNVELEAARMAESYALNSLNEWKSKAEELEIKVAETIKLERSKSESLESVMKQLEGNSDELHEAECELAALREKVSLLEISHNNRKNALEESETRLRKASEEAKEASNVVELLKSELETVKEEKMQALENEKLAALSVQDLLEEKNKLINEVEVLRKEEEKSKMAMESLTSALSEVSGEARQVKESLLLSQEEHENFENQIEHLQMVVKATSEKYESMLEDSRKEIDNLNNTVEESKIQFDNQMEDLKVVMKTSNEKYENMLDESKQEIDRLANTLEKSKLEHEKKKAKWEAKEVELLNCVKRLEEKEAKMSEKLESSYEESKAEWEQKEVELVNGLKRSEEEKSSMETEVMRLMNLLNLAEEKVRNVNDSESKLNLEVSSLKEALEEAEGDCSKLKENLRGTKNELENVKRENEHLRAVEDENTRKIEEMSKMLGEAKVKVNGELSDSDKDYDLLPKVVGFSEENGHLKEVKPQAISKEGTEKGFHSNGVIYPEEINGGVITPKNDRVKDDVESEAKMWESYKVDRDFSTEMETEQGSLDDEVESKADITESPSENGSNSDSKQKKKKKALYQKFGNLLKKGIK